jgi:hypothetical protein
MSKTIMLGHNLVLIHVLDCSRCFIRTLFRFKKYRIYYSQYKMGLRVTGDMVYENNFVFLSVL